MEKTIGKQPEKNSVHPLIKFNYMPRNLGLLLFGVIFVTLFYGSKNPYLWTAVFAQTILWPQLAYLVGKKSNNPRKTEHRNMCFEAFLCGAWMVIISFKLWPCAAFFIGGSINFLATGGHRLFIRGMLSFAGGIALTGFFIDFTFTPESSLATSFASLTAIITYTCIVAYLSFIYSKKINRHKLSLKEAHGEVQQKLITTRHEINERKRVEEELKVAIDKAESASREKSRFLASMSHEIRTPMNAIIGMTDLALMAETRDERLDYLATVKDSATHLLTIINDILDFSKTESGKLTLEYNDFDLHRLLEGVVKTFSFEADSKDLYLKLNIGDVDCRYVKGDPSRLKQVLINITGNAFKFTHEGGITINLDQITDNAASKEYLSFSIQDTGIGIPKEQTESIFDSFSQAERKTTRLYGGTGLGLAISKRIVGLMDGDIRVESEAGQGSTFYFTIPFYPGIRPEEKDSTNTPEKLNPTSKKLMILLAEDNPVNIRVTSIVLNKLGHSMAIATNGNAALERLKQSSFDLVLMDIEMPEMNGIEAATLIRSGKAGIENAEIPIIAMTAHVLDEIAVKCKEAGMNHSISKPINIETIEEIIQGVISEIKID